ncbi:hypothetical protein [Kitasatospora sp. NPDC002040]|uniref:hypothetical protein n=1 Tax=Kitasatospora sp. NPDC002040 TaxID=3154661 RepID=UPI00331C0BF3
MPMTRGQIEYWQRYLAATQTSPDRARALWDLARSLAGEDEAAWADLVRVLGAWTQARANA